MVATILWLTYVCFFSFLYLVVPWSIYSSGIYFLLISLIIGFIWFLFVLSGYTEAVKEYITASNKIEKYRKDKEIYKQELDEYKKEMKHLLVEEFKSFEEKIRDVIKSTVTDSKLLATLFSESKYHEMLNIYNNRIKDLVNAISRCDIKINLQERQIKDMEMNKFAYGWFLKKVGLTNLKN